MTHNRNLPLYLEIVGTLSFILAMARFDSTMTNNDFSVTFLFLGLVLFGFAGMCFEKRCVQAVAIIPFTVGVVGSVAVLVGTVGNILAASWTTGVILTGFFAVVAALVFFKIKK